MSWWHDLYDDLLADLLLERATQAEAETTCDFLLSRLALPPGGRVLDQCCGIGSLSLPLARRGFAVVAVDQCAPYVERGRREAAAAGLAVDFHAADALAFVPSEPVDGVFNWWTSFGYLPDDEGNQRMLRRAFEALRPGGSFLLDFMNVPGVLRHLQRDVVRRRETARGEVLLVRETTVDTVAGVMHKRWTYALPDRLVPGRPSEVRLYMPHEVGAMLRASGFVDLEFLGDEQGQPLLLDSPRLIVHAEAAVILHDASPGPDALRTRLYDGDVFLLPPTAASLDLARDARALLDSELGGDPRLAHERFDPVALFERIGAIRRTLFLEPPFHEGVRRAIAALGLDPTDCAFDPIRLRVVQHDGHHNPRARAVYYPHRDTWYAHPSAVVAFWIPLDDLRDEETFVFYPERFRTTVPNDSERFDYDRWVRRDWSLKIGWQNIKDGEQAHYPGTLGDPDAGPAYGFSCRRGDNLLFSGAHYHRTLPQSTGKTRYSLDFRFVHLGDLSAGRGAPNVDGRSTGSAMRDYVHTPPEP